MSKSNDEFNEKVKAVADVSEELEKSLKKATRKDFKRFLFFGIPIMLLLLTNIIPVSFGPYYSLFSFISSVILLAAYSISDMLRKDDEIENEIQKNMNKLQQIKIKKNKSEVLNKEKTVNNLVTTEEKRNFISNELSTCFDLQSFEEYMHGLFNILIEKGKINIESLNEKIIEQFVSPIQNLLGNDVKVILTYDLEADMIAKMQYENYSVSSLCYLYDGDKFYAYSPKKDTVLLMPMTKEAMFNIYVSNDENYKKPTISQFFSEIYGDIDDINDNKKRK